MFGGNRHDDTFKTRLEQVGHNYITCAARFNQAPTTAMDLGLSRALRLFMAGFPKIFLLPV